VAKSMKAGAEDRAFMVAGMLSLLNGAPETSSGRSIGAAALRPCAPFRMKRGGRTTLVA
jgi:hypothetical protein